MQTQMLIDGRHLAGQGPREDILDPATGATIAAVPEAAPEQVDAAVAAAERAFTGWAATAPKDRAAALLRVADHLESDAADYAALESQNTGKPLSAVLSDEIPAIADVFRFYAGACRTTVGPTAGEYLPGCTSLIRRDPV
ncbi:MAG: aldehyde dehydrogenase family protein, partial [Gammaproteobacteria bacterium]|nr:aldehyde dehydrogenase family protein [Gammaproteobacteria bacterium]